MTFGNKAQGKTPSPRYAGICIALDLCEGDRVSFFKLCAA
jgi:hypothetical protein